MNILLLGSGAREHAFAHALVRGESLEKLYILPGNPGTAELGINLPGSPGDFGSVKAACISMPIDMLVVGPEEPLVNGIHDFFENDPLLRHIAVIGPTKAGARLEGSKAFAKSFMMRHNIPTARFASFGPDELQKGLTYLASHSLPVVIKADGLAAGKGVIITDSRPEAQEVLTNMLNGAAFGEAGKKVVIEEFIDGIELSIFVLCDGQTYLILPEAKDYKKAGKGDCGPNTGGMGSVSPVPFATPEFLATVNERIVAPTIEGLKKEKINYTGFLFIGLIKVGDDPYVIEYNVRMGDPEAESVLRRLETPLLELLEATRLKELDKVKLSVSPLYAASVVLTSQGYPGIYKVGKKITFKPLSLADGYIHYYHGGTKSADGELVTSGGRVMVASVLAETFEEAILKANYAAETVDFEGKTFRDDIGFDL